MADHFFIVKQKLKNAITKTENNLLSFVNNPQKDFSRTRKLSFGDVLRFPLSLQGQCLDKEMLRAFSFSATAPTSSAMIQARSKIKISAWEQLFRVFTSACRKGASFHGYHLLAVDGSKFTLPENKKEPICWVKGPNNGQGHNEIQLNALYHLQSGIFEDVYFQPIHELDENQALAEMMRRSCIPGDFILVADRGYESYNTFAHIEEQGGKYVIRGRQGETGILSGLKLPNAEEFDQEVTVTICRKHSKETKENPKRYKRIRSNTKFDFCTEESPQYELHFRVVKIKVTETLTEILFTNLPKEEFTAEDLKKIYHMRWEIETAFLQLKYALSAMAVHSKKEEFVMQEICGKIIMFNFCKALIREVKVPQKENLKYEYKLNITMAMELCRNFWRSPEETAPPDFEKMLLKYLVPIRADRSFPRRSSARPATHFNDRIS